MTSELRPYQSTAVKQIADAFHDGHRTVLLVLPTGGGKTVIFSHIAEQAAAKGSRICVLVHRQELLRQASASLKALGVRHGLISPRHGMDLSAHVQVASVHSLARRLHLLPASLFQLLVVDEAHHSNAGTWAKVLGHFESARVLGVTATPCRVDGRGLGEWFTRMVLGPTAAELTAAGFLAPARVLAPPGPSLVGLRKRMGDYDLNQAGQILQAGQAMGDCLAHYRRYLDGQTAIAFCCSVAHAEAVARLFSDSGVAAASIDGTMDGPTRERLLADLGAGRLKVLTSCALIGEGVDVPSVAGCILLRPTQSVSLHLQMIGRCLRPQPGKTAVILDHVGNTQRLGHFLEERDWTLNGVPKKDRASAPSVRVCPNCFTCMPFDELVCAVCGHKFVVERRELEQVEGELVEVTGWRGQKLKIKPGDEVYKIVVHGKKGPYRVKRFTKCYVVCHLSKDDPSEYYFEKGELWVPPFRKGDPILRKNHKTKEWDPGWKIASYCIDSESALVIESSKYNEDKEYKRTFNGDLRHLAAGNFMRDIGLNAFALKPEQRHRPVAAGRPLLAAAA